MAYSSDKSYQLHEYVCAWLVHLFTASGIVFGFLAYLAIGEQRWVDALIWLLVAVLIDTVDGTLARYFNVKMILPGIDGKMLDYVIDFVTFVFLPAMFIHAAVALPESLQLFLIALILISSAYHYANLKAVHENQFFIGFPANWNVVAFYLFILNLDALWNSLLIILITILHFLPIKFLYLTRLLKSTFYALPLVLTWSLASFMVLADYPQPHPVWISVTLIIPCLYVMLSNCGRWVSGRVA